MPQAPPREPWNEALLDGANLRLAEEAAQAAGVPIERWIERAIRRACSGPGKITVLPPGALSEADAEPERRSPWRLLPLLAPPLLLLAGFAWLAQPPSGTGIDVALPKAPEAEVALPPAAAPAAPAAEPAPSDPAQLALWLEPRAAHGDRVAQYRLGTLYALGKGVAKDYARAAPLLHAAAESGLAEAEYDYAVLCEKGYGVAQDPPQAIAWYRKAAAQNNADAELALGYAYAKGIGVDRDMAQAAQWFRSAAELGVIDAQYNLAFLYEHGDGVAKSTADAYGWYAIAAAKGDQGSKDALDRLAKGLSPAELKAAEAHEAELEKSVKPEH
jgi:Sel1 repeat